MGLTSKAQSRKDHYPDNSLHVSYVPISTSVLDTLFKLALQFLLSVHDKLIVSSNQHAGRQLFKL